MRKPAARGEVVAEIRCHDCRTWLAYILHADGTFGLQTGREVPRKLDPAFTDPDASRVAPMRNNVAAVIDWLGPVVELPCPRCGRRDITREQIDQRTRQWRTERRQQTFTV